MDGTQPRYQTCSFSNKTHRISESTAPNSKSDGALFKSDDEDGHVDHATDDLKDVITTEQDFEAAKAALLEVSMQRLHMRNEMFSHPMSSAALDDYLTECGGAPIAV